MCDRSEEHREQLNRFPRRILKFTLLVEFILRGGKMCKFSTLCDRLLSLSVLLLNLFFVLQGIFLPKLFKSQY